MKVEDVPQDLKYDKSLVVRDVNYAVDKDGQYTAVVSDGWQVKNDIMTAVWEEILEECEPVRQQVLAKKISPLAYHMKKNLQDVGMLAAYSGIPKRKIKKHLRYEEFFNLDAKILEIYADALRVTVEELKRVD